ncbi:MAG: GMC family oxidoreductase, partial [Geminicoccaceae bacterium]
IGPGAVLRRAGVAVVADRPGVGPSRHDHRMVGIAAPLKPETRAPSEQRHHANAGLRYSSKLPCAPPHDMFLFMHSRFGWHPLGRRLGMPLVAVQKPLSRGWLRLPAPICTTS